MSWAAHELESYVIQKHGGQRLSYLAVLVGVLLPDLFTKLPVYGLNIGTTTLLKASTPYKYHRGWPGVGFTHSLLFGLLVDLAVLAVSRNRAWFLGLLVGQWSHVVTDVFDSVGTMALFPFTTQHYSTGMWAYAAQAGRYGDAAAYYSSLGGVWDFAWLRVALSGFKVLQRDFFFTTVVPNDPAWGWLRRKFGLSDRAILAVYRSYFIYGACRIVACFAWARFLNPARGVERVDWRWGGPAWVDKVSAPAANGAELLININTLRGGLFWVLAVYVLWRIAGRRLWRRAS